MKVSTPSSGTLIATMDGPPEETYCSTPISYSGSPVTISGTATFQAREPDTSGLGAPGSAKPVRYAEVIVKNSAGTTVQCSETEVDGDFSFQLPNDGGSYKVYVNSRASNSKLIASVLNTPEYNQHYSITNDFVSNATKNIGTLNAPATGTVLGGAFNIFDQLLETNEYLRTEVGTCLYGGCQSFTVAPKVKAYWRKGVNPGTYLNSSSALSFYLPSYSRLFILGGLNGDVDNTDTDHFDNSIIIHEYGHFLEDVISESNSPGGSHNGNKLIDPRLAWSEGWGNFLQAAVRNDPQYIDTKGNIDGSTSYYFKTDLETAASGSDLTVELGEGIFREFSVTRFLWDVIDSGTDSANGFSDNISGGFADIWAVFTKGTNGLLSPNLAFRNIGDFHVFQRWLETNNSGRNLASLRGVEEQVDDTSEYAQYVTTGSCSDFTMSPLGEVNCGGIYPSCGSFASSNLLRNNDFYHIKISSTQTYTFLLEYQDADGSGNLSDADLYIYNKSARYGVYADLMGKSDEAVTGTVATPQSEQVSVSLSAGDYLINVRVYTGTSGQSVGSDFNYTLKLNGSQLCPSSLP